MRLRNLQILSVIALSIIVISSYIYAHIWLFSIESSDSLSARRKWNIPTLAVQLMAGEFKGVMADLLTMEAGAQLGTELAKNKDGEWTIVNREQDWDAIIRIFNHSLTLDPYFKQTYLLIQSELPWAAKRLDKTMEFLAISRKHRVWDWRPAHLMGFNTYYFLNRQGEAGKIFLEAAKTPNAPSFLSIVGARLAQKGGETEAAIMLMRSMLMNKDENDEGYDDIVDRMQALEGVKIIEDATSKFTMQFGRKPLQVNDLIVEGLIKQKPYNPYGHEYCFDSESRIQFDLPSCQ